MSRLATAALVVLWTAPAFAQIAIGPAEAVRIALEQNPSLAAAVASLERASWAVIQEDASFAPTLRLDAGASHSESPAFRDGQVTRAGIDQLQVGSTLSKRLRLGTDLALRIEHNSRWEDGRDVELFAIGPVYDTSARLELTQPFWRGSGRAVVEAALRQAQGAEAEALRAAERTASQLVRDVLVAWWELWYAEEALRIEQESLALAERQRDEAKRKVELGTAASVSVLTFETRVAERQESVAAAIRQRQERVLALAAQLGDAGLSVTAAPPDLPHASLPDPETLRRLAGERSPAVREAEAALNLAAIRAEVSADPFRPRLDVQGFAQVGGLSRAYAGFEGSDRFAWTAGVNLIFELPLSGSLYRSAAAQASLAVREADLRLSQARLSAETEVDAEWARYESARERVELARRTLEMAEAQLEAEQRKYEIGTSTPIEVLQAEESVRSARLRLARAEVDLRNAESALEHLSGALVTRWVEPLLASRRP